MKFLVYICRVLVGSLFIISGLIKVNDALGFYYKLQEYAEPGAFNLAFLDEYGMGLGIFVSIAEILLGVALVVGALPKLTTILSAVMMVFFTVLTGYTCNCDPDGTTTIVMVNDTGIEVQETIPNQCVLECGCFGNAIPLKACESYAKDWIICIFLLPILIWALMGRIQLNTKQEDIYLFAGSLGVLMWFCMTWLDWLWPVLFTAVSYLAATAIKRRSSSPHKEWFMAAAILVITGAVQWYTLSHLPLKDYRPYAEGKNISIQMLDVDGLVQTLSDKLMDGDKASVNAWLKEFDAVDPDVAIALRGKASQILALRGQAKQDSIDALPAAAARAGLRAPELATEFTFRNTKTGADTIVLSTDWLKIYNEPWFKNTYENVTYEGKSITLSEGVEPNIVDLAPENYDGEPMLDAILDAEWVFLHVSKDLNTASTGTQQDLNALAKAAEAAGVNVYGMTNAGYDEAEAFRHEHQAAYPFLVADQIEMKIIVRSNPGLVLLNRGTVVKKWAWRDVPVWDDVKGNLIP